MHKIIIGSIIPLSIKIALPEALTMDEVYFELTLKTKNAKIVIPKEYLQPISPNEYMYSLNTALVGNGELFASLMVIIQSPMGETKDIICAPTNITIMPCRI